MTRARASIIIIVTLFVGFGAGLILRPVIMPPPHVSLLNIPPQATAPAPPRGTKYFEVHIDEARMVVAACRQGTMRGDECANAETAVVTVESRERFRRFRRER